MSSIVNKRNKAEQNGQKKNKRRNRKEVSSASSSSAMSDSVNQQQDLVFEDPYEDDLEAEEIIVNGNDAIEEDDDNEEEVAGGRQLFRPGIDQLEEDEELEYDNSAYIMLHRMNVEWPCLSFDFLRDSLGSNRTKLPATCFLVAGTQAAQSHGDKIIVMKTSDLHKTRKDKLEEDMSDSDSDSDDDSIDGTDDDPVVDSRYVKHTGAVNRIRSMPQAPHIVSTWSDAGRVYLWDLSAQIRSLGGVVGPTATGAPTINNETAPIFSFKGHKDEGYALDWSVLKAGRMASGDCKRSIYVWQVREDGQCAVDPVPFSGHGDSVEDLQWSSTEESVLASCSVDLSVRIWDVREKKKSMVTIDRAHEQDVNVISWNKKVPFLLASGSDDGSFKVWDLRMLKRGPKPEPVGFFKWHKAPITSLQWHPHDETVIVAAGADHQVSVWDFGLEEDLEQAKMAPKLDSHVVGSTGEKLDIPPQLLFLHQGQIDPKEIRFHPQIPGLIGSTASDGFHMLIPEPLDPKGISEKYLKKT